MKMTDRLNPEALEAASDAVTELYTDGYCPKAEDAAEVAVSAYLAALPAPRTITTVEQLDALPVGSVILDGDPAVLQMVEKSQIVGSEWAMANEEHIYTTGKITLPALVLWVPTEGGGE